MRRAERSSRVTRPPAGARALVAACGAPDDGRSGGSRGHVRADYGSPPWRISPVRDGKSEADRAARLGALSLTVAGAASACASPPQRSAW